MTTATSSDTIEKDLEFIRALKENTRKAMVDFIHERKSAITASMNVQWAEAYADGSWAVAMTSKGCALSSYACETLWESIERDLKVKSVEELESGQADPWAYTKTYAEKEALNYLNYEIIEFFFHKLKNI